MKSKVPDHPRQQVVSDPGYEEFGLRHLPDAQDREDHVTEPLTINRSAGDWEHLAWRLRSIGQRATPQRLVILGALEQGRHLSADEIYARIEGTIPGLNRSTVYRNLELLRDLGLISETDLGGGTREYELIEERHHHLVCRTCGEQWELADDVVSPLRERIAIQYGFTAGIDHLAIFGTCAVCQSRVDPAE